MKPIHYTFNFADGRCEKFELRFDQKFQLVVPPEETLPEWSRLKSHQCENCPLDTEKHTHCPLAAALAGPISRLANVVSYEPTRVEVFTTERTVCQDTTAQDGISAMLGLINATSGCPITGFFRPMARFHLPFASEAETLYRAATMCLLGDYFRAREGYQGKHSLDGLFDIYRNIEKVNRGIVARIRDSRSQDGPLNAIVLLDLYAKSLPFSIEESLSEIRSLFDSYLH